MTERPRTEPDPRVVAPKSAEPSTGKMHRGRVLLFESVLIVLSVLLGFALSAWGERRADKRTVEAAIENFRVEIEANLRELQRVQPKHEQFAERLADVVDEMAANNRTTAFDVFVENMPEGGLDTPPLKEAAWETAMSTGALSLLEYKLAATLSETYLVQRSTLAPTLSLLRDRFAAPANYEPAQREAMLRVHQIVLTELAGQEAYLIDIYRNALAQLDGQDRE